MEIGERLKAVASLVPDSGIIADIGCDHGKLALWLWQTGRYEKIIATDISKPSLEKARKLSSIYNAPVDCRFGSGLSPLQTGEASVIVMAGWGGLQIYEAIQDQIQTAREALLVLQPMTHGGDLRYNLVQSGFGILAETLSKDSRGRLYEVFAAKYGQKMEEKDPFIVSLGPVLYRQKHPLLKTKIEKRVNAIEKTLCTLEEKETAAANKRKTELLGELDKLREVKEWLNAKTY